MKHENPRCLNNKKEILKLQRKISEYLCFGNFTEIQQRDHKSYLKKTLMGWKDEHSSKK